jgi:hypothetical protein
MVSCSDFILESWNIILLHFLFSPHCSGRVISGGGDLSSDGSPVSTPGHSPYSSCTNLANIDDEFSGFDDDIEGRNQCKLNFGKICQNKDVILTNCLDMEKTDGGSERPSSVMNPTVKCEILLQKGMHRIFEKIFPVSPL